MTKSNLKNRVRTSARSAAAIGTLLVLAACGQGDGPDSIANTPATPLPPIPAGFCDPINFELLCELPGIVNFNGGATTVIDNPDASGINTSERVAKMQKFGEEVFGGTRLDLDAGIDFSEGEFYKMKVWAQRPVPVSLKLEETGNPAGGVTLDQPHTGGGTWEELCYDFTGLTAGIPNPPVLALTIIFDNGVLGNAQAGVDDPDWTFYYDDIEQVSSCSGSGGGGGVSPIDPDSALFSTSGAPDLVIPDDYSEVTPFGSGSVIDPLYADDSTFSPVVSVFSGTGYGANVAQIGYIGFQAGFLGAYETVDFKVKGMPNQVLFVRLFDNVDSLRINLTSSAYSGDIGDGWFQVSIPVSAFEGVAQATGIVMESDDTAAMQFRMLLTDIGFSGTGANPPPPPPPPFDSGLLTNGDFEAGTAPWLAGVTNPIAAANVINDGGNQVFFVDVTAAGNAFDVNLSQKLSITPDESYTLTFKARSNVARTILAGIGLSGGSFANTTESVNLTTDWQTFTVELTATGFGDADSRVLFDMGAEVGEVYIDDVALVVSTGGGGGDPFDSGLLTNGDFESGTSPWLAGVTNPIDAANVIDDGGNQVFFVDVTAAGNAFDVNLSQKLTITPDESYTLTFMARSNVARTMLAGIGLSGGSFANTTESVNLTTDWQSYTVELTATGFGDNDSRVLFDMGAEVGQVFIDDVSLVVASGGGGGGGGGGNGSFANGDFETGDFTGWTLGNDGTYSVVSDTLDGRTGNFARLQTTDAPQDVLLSQVALGAGSIMTGDMIDVSFDLYGTLTGASGVVFVEVIYLNAAGQDEGGRNFVGPAAPYFPNTTWTTYTGTVTAGTATDGSQFDVSGGVTLQLKAACGGVPDCVVDAYFDNVTFTVNGGGG